MSAVWNYTFGGGSSDDDDDNDNHTQRQTQFPLRGRSGRYVPSDGDRYTSRSREQPPNYVFQPRNEHPRRRGNIRRGLHSNHQAQQVSVPCERFDRDQDDALHIDSGRRFQPSTSSKSLKNASRREHLRSLRQADNKNKASVNACDKSDIVVQQAERYMLQSNSKTSHFSESTCGKPQSSKISGGREAHNQKAKKRFIGFKKLEELIEKESNEILLTLCMPDNGLSELLENAHEKRDLMALILIAVGKACASLHRSNVMSLISTVTENKHFMFFAVLQYLVSFQNSNNKRWHLDSLFSLLQFLECYQKYLTASSSELVPALMPLLKTTYQKVFKEMPDKLVIAEKRIREIETQHDHFIKSHSQQEIKKASKSEKENCLVPPENFRDIPIFPNQVDIWDYKPFLRSNIVNGKYSDADHYLDVQFRLLREDYVRPLREGIATYIRLKKQGKPMSKNKDVRIYQNVHIIKQEFLNGKLIHLASFNIKDFAHVKWEHSKRFISGSLVCLSQDDFETMFFASVAFRDCEKLKHGILILKFEELSCDILNITPIQSFVMIETTAYFEAYRHNLTALQSMVSDYFPLKAYIVDVQKDVQSPRYLQRNTTYDMTPLASPISSQMKRQIKTEGLLNKFLDIASNLLSEKSVSLVHEANVSSVIVLDDSLWPKNYHFDLDASQHEALKTAITKEFAIIQGPPGTGKTFVSLKIVQLLLHNSSKWEPGEKTNPILIVCYTNHALDQFLEGIMSYTNDIVRIGGRCSSLLLEEYRLQNIKSIARQKREVPHHIHSNVKHQQLVLDELKREISKVSKEIDRSCSAVLKDEDLRLCMEPRHFESLKSVISVEHVEFGGDIITKWLGIHDHSEEGWEHKFPKLSDNASNTVLPNALVPVKNISSNQSLEHVGFSSANGKLIAVNDDLQNPVLGMIPAFSLSQEDEEEEYDVDFVEDMREVETEDLSAVKLVDETVLQKASELYTDGNWQIKGGVTKRKEYIIKQLSDSALMLDSEVEKISNVWRLRLNDRWRLYKYWLHTFHRLKQEESLQIQLQIQAELKKLEEMRTEEELYILRKARIIGMTTTGAAKYRNLVLNVQPKIIVVEEAAEVLEAHIVTSLVQETEHLILIGDHQQLRPSPNVYELATRFNLSVSLFERMVKNGMPFCQLLTQHRMRPSIAQLLVPHIYPALMNDESVKNYDDIKGVTKNVYFISHNYVEGSEIDSKSHVNEHEAKFIVQLCKYFLLQGYDASQITILTTYSGQLFAIKKLANKFKLFNGVRITVVDNFQGEENDIILVSFVRSNDEGSIGFLKVSNRVCVALSRAKKGLFCIGNFNLLAENSELWKNIVLTLKKQEAIGPSLRLQCQNHKDVFTEVSTEKDFNKVPEGGCTRLCEYRLGCGHTCTRVCHSYDREHTNIKCQKPCTKILCELGHKCPLRCYEKCGPCKVLVNKTLPGCKHNVLMPCYIAPHEFQCTEPCTKSLPCGHKCQKHCGESCQPQDCKEKVFVVSLCGHTMNVNCYIAPHKKTYLSLCNEACQSQLQCGHTCKGTCGKCHQGRLHEACKNRCSRILVCGHECRSLCSNICPPCKQKCENRCAHSQCPKKCGEPCNVCMEPCNWSCEHQTCTEPCGLKCSRKPCDQPCNKTLSCDHKCVGLCGEPCPDMCAICQKEEVTSIFFGTEEETDARFIKLEDCGHILEVEGLTHWMSRGSKDEIQMKSCPKCKTVIRRNLHFGNAIKSCLEDIEKVKKIIYGDEKKNAMKKHILIDEVKAAMYAADSEQLLKPVLKYLENKKKLSNPDLMRAENVIKIIKEYLQIKEIQILDDLVRIRQEKISSYIAKLLEFTKETEDLISDFIQVKYSSASEQQLEDITWELLRYKLQSKLFQFLERLGGAAVHDSSIPYLSGMVECLCKFGAFRGKDEEVFNNAFEKMSRLHNQAVLNVTENEKKMILNAMNMSRGHWFQCPNGHVYCITECGGAMEESTCNECGAKVGGHSHTLRSDNRLASQMDGAVHSAWTEAINMNINALFN